MTAAATAAAEHLGHYEAGSPEWLAARAGALGGSEIAAVLGLSPFESRFSLWHRKAGAAAPVAETDEMRWGKRLEAPIADEYADLHPDVSVEPTGMWRNRERRWQVVSPDRFLIPKAGGKRRLLEIKNPYNTLGWGDPGTDEVPVYYRTQALWYVDGFDEDDITLAALISGCDYREYLIRRDDTDIEVMRAAAAEFLDTLAAGKRPNVDDHAATYQVLREMHPEIDPYPVDVPGEIAEPYLAAVGAAKAADADKRRATSELAAAMGTAHRAVYMGQTIATRVPGKNGGPPYVRVAPEKEAGQRVSAA